MGCDWRFKRRKVIKIFLFSAKKIYIYIYIILLLRNSSSKNIFRLLILAYSLKAKEFPLYYALMKKCCSFSFFFKSSDFVHGKEDNKTVYLLIMQIFLS